MNRFSPFLMVVGLLAGYANASPAVGASPSSLVLAQTANERDNPTNSPIRRANPNSRQGSESSTPPLRGPNTLPTPRPQTIENGAIGNGYPRAQPQPRPINPGPARSNPNEAR